ncbi:MAG: DUF721 domain-containing protein [Muribaculaceae bacterium]|nr:DUF721 domain-containing protein [Muribaculaceae bacterium]
MKKRYPQSISEIIDNALRESDISSTVDEQRICYLWPEIVGAGINRYTTRRYVESGALHVYISSGALKNELQFHRSHLVDALNRAVGRQVINNIIIH